MSHCTRDPKSLHNSDKANRFLWTYEDVSSILGIYEDCSHESDHVFEAEDVIVNESSNDPDHVFVRIVLSLQMNTADPGLDHLNYMSQRSKCGVEIDDVLATLSIQNMRDVADLCREVMRGISYVFEKSPEITIGDSCSVAYSFIEYLDAKVNKSDKH